MTNPGFITLNTGNDAATETHSESTESTKAAEGTGKVHDLIIIGSGPSGYTAAIYAARAELNPLVFEGYEYGGELMNTTEVENFPGFAEGVMGPDLMGDMRDQAERFGADLRSELVERVDFSGDNKKVYVDGEEFQAKAIILATGAAPRHLGVPGEAELTGHGVSTCATCDGFFFKDHHIAVVGGGDSAMEEADFLSKFGSKVTLIHRSQNFRASKIMLQRARDNEKIEFLTDTIVEEVIDGGGKVEGLGVRNVVTGEASVLDATAMFVAIGHDPRSGFLEGQVTTDQGGYVQVAEPSTATSVPGVFAAGDLVDKTYRQAITAAGSGCRAALDAQHYLAAL
ncbi:Thioredoxin reductase [Corynebacterium glaucum]|uniref:Thioredoxin reductase n=1 Tax=Corynebacterium glaucum TaxID=187491 RepID=A0A1Q2HZW5_9CORY|nr:thioredoxin-disulfide reductase [Corynebacterium glaucum]AQQ16374.1 Thioredoxin reductase [Corynebacterium glaucum]